MLAYIIRYNNIDYQPRETNGNARELVKEYYTAIKNNPGDSKLYFTRAKAFIQLNDWNNALTHLNDAIQLSPNKANYYLGRAYVYYRLGKKILAQKDLDQARFYNNELANNIRFHTQ